MDQSKRLISIDAFRGLTIAFMILVGFPGSWDYVYHPLDHAEWLGWTPTDFIFPWFLFISGVSMVFSFAKRGNHNKIALYRHIALRSGLIVLIGLLINFFPDFNLATLRYSGVIQRIGLIYFITSIIYLNTSVRSQIWISIITLLFYGWLMMSFGDMTPEGNLAGRLDRLILGAHGRVPTDPEGILGILPSVVSMLAGCLTGAWLRSGKNKNEIVGWLYFTGWVLILVGLFWSIGFPISKRMWTSSYVVFTTGAALQLLAVCYWLIEIKGYTKWAKPAVIYGSNALLVYILHIFEIRLFTKALAFTAADGTKSNVNLWLWQHYFVPWAGEWIGSLAFAIVHVFLWLGIMTLFYRKRIFVKL